jgi:hypothetical protein
VVYLDIIGLYRYRTEKKWERAVGNRRFNSWTSESFITSLSCFEQRYIWNDIEVSSSFTLNIVLYLWWKVVMVSGLVTQRDPTLHKTGQFKLEFVDQFLSNHPTNCSHFSYQFCVWSSLFNSIFHFQILQIFGSHRLLSSSLQKDIQISNWDWEKLVIVEFIHQRQH